MRKSPRIYDVTDAFQRESKAAFERLNRVQLLDGRAITGVELSTTPTAISHGLGRIPAGWIITDINAAATVHRVSTATERTRYLTLTASAICTVNLWIY